MIRKSAHRRPAAAATRRLLASTVISGLILSLAAPTVSAQSDLLVLGGATQKQNLNGESLANGGIDILTPFEKQDGAKIIWNESTNPALQEALQRLGPLPKVSEDVIYVHQFDTNSRLPDFLEPLDGYLDKTKIAGFPGDWPPGITDASVFGGKRYLVPIRCGAMTLWYNDAMFADRGLTPPKVPEDIYAIAKQGTYTKPNGEKVYGVAFRGTSWSITEDLAALARMYGGDIVDANGKVTVNEAPAVAAVNLLKRLYKEGLMPPNWAALDQSGVNQLFKDGHVAMTLGGTNYNSIYNDGSSTVNGHAVATRWPLAAELQTANRKFGAGTVFYWGLGILKGSTDKQLAADFIRYISTPASVHALAINGSGPCTANELGAQAKLDPAMQIQAEIFSVSRGPLPANPNINQIRDILGETIQNIVVKDLDTQSELDDLAKRMTRLYR